MTGVVRCRSCAGLEPRCPECQGTGWTEPPTPWLVEFMAFILLMIVLLILVRGFIELALFLDRN